MVENIMKKAFVALLLVASTGTSFAQQAPIFSVIVYGDRAQITRRQAVDCKAEQTVFSELPLNIDLQSVTATLYGAQGHVVGVKHQQKATGSRPEAKALQEKIRELDDKLRGITTRFDASRALEKKLSSLRNHLTQRWGVDARGKRPNTKEWDAALDLLQNQTRKAVKKRQQATLEQRDLGRQRELLRRQLRLLAQGANKTTLELSALVKCSGRGTVALSYVVPAATWRVSYQLRTDPKTKRAKLVTRAIVQQGTGENWKNVRLAVSTANIQRLNVPPTLARMKVTTYAPETTQKVLVRRHEQRTHLTTNRPRGKLSTGKPADGEPGAANDGLAMQLMAAQKVTVPSDGRQVVVELASKSVPADIVYESVPKLFPYVYEKVEIPNPFSFTMVAGPVELYNGSTFLGRGKLKRIAPGEPFSLSLGVSDQLQVHRYVKQEELKGSGAFGSSKSLHHRYSIQVGNWTNKKQKIRILENIPVSQVQEIKVRLSAAATTPTKHNKADGILTWDVQLNPRSKRVLLVEYVVEIPKDYIVR